MEHNTLNGHGNLGGQQRRTSRRMQCSTRMHQQTSSPLPSHTIPTQPCVRVTRNHALDFPALIPTAASQVTGPGTIPYLRLRYARTTPYLTKPLDLYTLQHRRAQPRTCGKQRQTGGGGGGGGVDINNFFTKHNHLQNHTTPRQAHVLCPPKAEDIDRAFAGRDTKSSSSRTKIEGGKSIHANARSRMMQHLLVLYLVVDA